MATYDEKRSCQRYPCEAPIGVTRFKTGYCNWCDAQILNHSSDGVCVKSSTSFQPGTTVLVRIQPHPSNSFQTISLDGLRAMSIGEVKWCAEHPDEAQFCYDLGVKYHVPDY